MPDKDGQTIPTEILELLRISQIGYLSLTSKDGDIYSYPIAYFFSGEYVYFATPIGSAKIKFLRENPKVSLIVDNRKLTTACSGAMIQGDVKIFSIAKTLTSITSMLPNTINFAKKYPAMFTFYAKGKELPDERKIYKYRFIRINIKKIIFWMGYQFGRYIPKKTPGLLGKLFEDVKGNEKKGESVLESISRTIQSSDGDIDSEKPIALDESWMTNMNEAASKSSITANERRIIEMFTKNSMDYATKTLKDEIKKISETKHSYKVSSDEQNILKKWKTDTTNK